MNPRVAGRLAWSLWSATAAIAIAAGALLFSHGFAWPAEAWGFPGFAALLAVPFATVGTLVVWRRPANGIGWMFVAIGFGSAVQELVLTYGAIAYGAPMRPLPGAAYAAWVAEWISVPLTGGITVFLVLLFPHGSLPGRRWRPVATIGALGMVLAIVGLAFAPGPLGLFPPVDNPLGVLASREIADVLSVAGMTLFGLASLVASIGLALRWRRAGGVERQQYKWLAVAAVAITVALWLRDVVTPLIAQLAAIVGFATIPVAVGVAVLRYRLYEIDRLISRTVSYAVIVAILAAVYLGGVFVLRGFVPLEGDLAVAASTLAVAALFTPLRRRVQHLVDRRFNRPRYDAEIEVQRFAGRLRTHLDIDDLSDDLSGVITRTMHPETTALWLRGDRSRATGSA